MAEAQQEDVEGVEGGVGVEGQALHVGVVVEQTVPASPPVTLKTYNQKCHMNGCVLHGRSASEKHKSSNR